ncbi:1,4-alpha-glucan branching protein GlgB [Desemzia incerta]|uniref:1,4-alpha-glucan branching protein GlgB n=1 Tax=Desemzia incerta TaxID=82801 RepID=UPI0016612909|nr:1,4-alpha-glucan branching protein GlgB [Desemzia incerta]
MENHTTNQFDFTRFKKESYLFNTGKYYDCYYSLGCHKEIHDGQQGYRFTVWAPHAKTVSLVSDCTDWNMGKSLEKIDDTEMWTVFCETAKEGQPYKYRIEQQDGTVKLKIDPQAFEFEVRPKEASVIKELPQKKWRDGLWMANKKRFPAHERPLNIYEVHMSSWNRHPDGSWYSIPELQAELIPYVKENGYTHIEFLPLMEHPLDASWGYQATGYFALSSKFGTIEEMQDFVEAAHLANVGVLMDWVPSHYNKNDYGMAYFDGTPQYEYKDYHKAQNYRWGTLNFDLGKPQVHSFLISNALFWIEQFHLDGLRVDAVSNMLYLDYDEGEWTPNEDGSNHNREGVSFIQKLNNIVFERHPDTLMIAEESTAWEKVTGSIDEGGLGFNYKWNMGWMNDTLRFFEMDPIHRKNHFNLLTFSFMYMFNENYLLPFSHDEVVHGKKSLMHKMPGDRYNQFAGLRVLEAYRMVHPGKKLGFMGNEFGQFLEWKFDDSLEWENLTDPMNQKHLDFTRTLNQFYKEHRALWELDHDPRGIQILDADNAEESIMTFIRKGKKPRDFLIVICNFVPIERHNYRVGVPFEGQYEEILNTEMEALGGTWTKGQGVLKTEKKAWNQQEYSLNLIVPALSVVILKPKRVFKVPKE